MSDTAVTESPQTTPVLPDTPTLPAASAAPAPALPPEQRQTASPLAPDNTAMTPSINVPGASATTEAAPSLPVVSPVLTAPAQPAQPVGAPTLSPAESHVGAMPTLPDAPEVTPTTIGDPTDAASDLPAQSKASEASKWAAEVRAAQKAKAKKIKIGIIVGALAFAALVGPPTLSWLTNAINEVGTTTEEPAE